MINREKVIEGLCHCTSHDDGRDKFGGVGKCAGCPYYGHDCTNRLQKDALALLKEQELPTELKQKMWNALYAEEDEYEKKFVGKEEHLNWFAVYRPWLQKGFDIAINVIAEWEGL